jgi:hypothetical protein
MVKPFEFQPMVLSIDLTRDLFFDFKNGTQCASNSLVRNIAK